MTSSLLSALRTVLKYQSKLWLKLTALLSLLVFPATWGPWGVLSARENPQMPEFDVEALYAVIEGYKETESVLRQQAKPLNELVQTLGVGVDATPIVEWVRNNTSWVSYEGFLKGVEGTYYSSCGNMLDRSVLLAAMIKYAGFDVKIAHLELNSEQREFLEATYSEQIPEYEAKTWVNFDERIQGHEEALEVAASEKGVPLEEYLANISTWEHQSRLEWEQLQSDVDQQSKLIEEKLGEASGEAVTGFVENHYFYVSYMNEGSWYSVCPQFGNEIPSLLSEGNMSYYQSSDEIPASLKHQLQIVLEIDKLADGNIETHTVMDLSYDVVDVSNQQIVFSLNGEQFGKASSVLEDDSLSEEEKKNRIIESVLKETRWVMVAGIGDDLVAKGFDENGDVFDPNDSSENAIGTSLRKATGFLSSLGELSTEPKSNDHELVAVKIRFLTIVPGTDAPLEQVRKLYEMKPEVLESVKTGTSLSEEMQAVRAASCNNDSRLLVQTSKWSVESFAADQLEVISKARFLLEYMVRLVDAGREDELIEKLPSMIEKMPSTDQVLGSLALMRSTSPVQTNRLYLSKPNLLRTTSWFYPSEASFVHNRAIDIIQNSMDTLAQDGKTARMDRIQTGVWDTLTEKMIVEKFSDQEKKQNATSMFDGAVSSTDLYVDVDDGSNSNHLKIYRENLDGHWYQVDAKTGESLGMIETPDGIILGGFVEYIITHWKVALLAGGFAFFGCWGGPGSGTGLACFACALMAAFGAALAAIAIASAGAAGLTVSEFLALAPGAGAAALETMAAICGVGVAVSNWGFWGS